MSAAQLNADVRALNAALYRMQADMGGERFAAARAGLGRLLAAPQQAASPSARPHQKEVGAPSPAPVVADPPSASASEQASIDETLALARAAGVGRFGAVQEGKSAAAVDDASDTLALAREAGIGRYGQ